MPAPKLLGILFALASALALAAAPPPAAAQSGASSQEVATDATSGLVGVAAALGTLVYTPLKLTYAITGALISGMAWLWTVGDSGVAGPILRQSVGGDYVLLPSHVRFERPLRFVGPS